MFGREPLDAVLEPADGSHDVNRETAEAFDLDAAVEDGGPFDLILFSNVLNELAEPAAVLERYLGGLADDGTLLVLEPADRNTATGLREVERAVADDGPATVYAPTVRLWPHHAPESESWSFDVRPDLDVPAVQRALDRGERGPESGGERADADREPGDGEFINVDVQFAYSVLRTDGERALDFRPSRGEFARLADSEAHVTDRVNVAAVKLSRDLTAGGDANPLFRVGDGSQRVDHFAVLVDGDSLNAPLREADYGDLLTFERVLVLWNDDEGAYNLVVDEEVVVESVPVPP